MVAVERSQALHLPISMLSWDYAFDGSQIAPSGRASMPPQKPLMDDGTDYPNTETGGKHDR